MAGMQTINSKQNKNNVFGETMQHWEYFFVSEQGKYIPQSRFAGMTGFVEKIRDWRR